MGQTKILLGQDHANLIVEHEVFDYGNVYLSRTLLGWVAHGSVEESEFKKCRVYTLCEGPQEQDTLKLLELNDSILKFFSFATLGISNTCRVDKNENRAYDIL